MKKSIGFIGTGVMGASMAGHLLDAGHRLTVHNRSPARARGLLDRGAAWASTPAEVAGSSDITITIVGYPADVESVYLGVDGLISSAAPGAMLIDMTTSCPQLARRIHAEGAAAGISVLDAPVSGGDLGAREARLSIMVGGDEPAFRAALPILEVMGANIVHQGPAGSGQHTKMANQIAIAAGMLGVCEAMAYAEAAGLDQETVLASIGGGAAGSWSLTHLAPRMIAGDFDPGFYVKHFIKDMNIAVEAAEDMGMEAPGLHLARKLYEKLAEAGGADLGTQALYQLYTGGEG